jgi:glutathione-regulated potassium-efflux system ancillary protein KefG
VLAHRPGHLFVHVYTSMVARYMQDTCTIISVPTVKTEDLIDAQGVAEILGLAHRNAVSAYQRRYPDMPRPVLNLGANRPLLWLRPQIEDWAKRRPPVRRGRPPLEQPAVGRTGRGRAVPPRGNRPPSGGAGGSGGGRKPAST